LLFSSKDFTFFGCIDGLARNANELLRTEEVIPYYPKREIYLYPGHLDKYNSYSYKYKFGSKKSILGFCFLCSRLYFPFNYIFSRSGKRMFNVPLLWDGWKFVTAQFSA